MIDEEAAFSPRISASGEIVMTSKKPILPMILVALVASLSLQACNTVSGLGKDVSAGADAVTDTAEENKGY